jgi:hypothetical protein
MKYNFIIPYRNRKEHLDEFVRRFSEYTKDIDAEFYIVHQLHPGDFNRGALCNIGFIEFCKTRPDGLFIFHDVDVYPTFWGSIQYDTRSGEIRHPIGDPNFGLGGICCFWKSEFEKVNGFPNYWGWGVEDVTIMYRAKNCGIHIDESGIVNINNKEKCISPKHYKNISKEKITAQINTELHHNEMSSGYIVNGLLNLDYTVLSDFELVPRFTIINVDFKLKD